MIDSSLFELIKSIRPTQMFTYLASQSWREDGSIAGNASIWHRAEDQYFDLEIVQPLRKDLKDYVNLTYVLISTLSQFENRSVHDVIDDLINFNADVVKIRVAHEDVENGSIPLSDGVLLIEKAKELLMSVTKSTYKKRPHFSGRVSPEIAKIVDTFRLGQTEVGSYVVNLIMPLNKTPNEQSDMNEVSLTRLITQTLSKSLTAIDTSIAVYRNSHEEQAFDSAVQQGVSANLCDALVGLTGQNQSRNVDIKISLSRSDSESDDMQLNHSFNSDVVEHLKRASDYFKEKYTIIGYVVCGHVTGLKHEDNEEVGVVTVASMINGREKHVTFELSTEEYWEAHQAHREIKVIECRGDILVTPRSANLINVTGFKVLGSGNLFEHDD